MSVPVWQRGENQLLLFTTARNFSIYILKITSNEKVFLKEFKTSITDRLNQSAMDLYLNVWKAQNIPLKQDSADMRRELQRKALLCITDFIAIWELGAKAFHLRTKRTKYVIGQLIKLDELIRDWIKKDIKELQNKKVS